MLTLASCRQISYNDQLFTAMALDSVAGNDAACEYLCRQESTHQLTFDERLSIENALIALKKFDHKSTTNKQ